MEELNYIKANDTYYRPQNPGVQKPGSLLSLLGYNCPVCFIKKLWFGRWQIDYYDERLNHDGDALLSRNQVPNCRVILYPNGIQEIRYNLK